MYKDRVASRIANKAYKKRKVLAGLCVQCGAPRGRDGRYCAECACYLQRRAALRKQRKLSMLGEVCVVCGESDVRMLQIDHVKADREGRSGVVTLREIQDSPERFQILCANHHAVKTYENGDQHPNSVRCDG